MTNKEHCLHEELIQDHSLQLKELNARADFKDQRIEDLNKKMETIEGKIDSLTETVNSIVLASVKDDNDIKQEVIALKARIKSHEESSEKYKEEQKEQRDNDRAKTNQLIAVAGVIIAALSLALKFIG